MAMTMIERVARALCTASGVEPDKPADPGDGWFVPCWKLYGMHARVAIEAMREPTARMLPDEGVQIGFFHDADGIEDNLYADKDEARDIWRAMIDAALSEADA